MRSLRYDRARTRQQPIFGGPTLRSVVFKKNVREDGRLTAEFSWWEKPTTPRHHRAIAAAWHYAKYARNLRAENLCRLARVRYYKNSEAAGAGGSCWFRRNTVYVGSVGNHDFYRPHQNVFEWKQGTSRDCYRTRRMISKVTPRSPRPKPAPPSTSSDLTGSVALLEASPRREGIP